MVVLERGVGVEEGKKREEEEGGDEWKGERVRGFYS